VRAGAPVMSQIVSSGPGPPALMHIRRWFWPKHALEAAQVPGRPAGSARMRNVGANEGPGCRGRPFSSVREARVILRPYPNTAQRDDFVD